MMSPVLIGLIATAVDPVTVLVDCRVPVDLVPVALHIAVQVGHVGRDLRAGRVVPGAAADPVARVHGAGALRAEVGMPGRVAPAGSRRQRLAVRIRSGEAAQIGAVTLGSAGDKKGHRFLWSSAPALREQIGGAQSHRER